MKKLLYAVLLCVLALVGLSAQSVQYYDFSVEQGGTYAALENATALEKMMEAPKDRFPFTVFNATESKDFGTTEQSVTMAGIPLGFDFTYEGKVFDKFVISGMGYICLGLKSDEQVRVNLSGNPTLGNMYRMIPNTIGVSTNVFDTCRAAAQYKAEGEDGSKTMTVEFHTGYNGLAQEQVFNYQVRLYESGKIEMLFDEFKVDWGFDPFTVGVSGEGSNYYMRPDGGDFGNVEWNNSNGGGLMSKLLFEKGLKYTFMPPAACQAPTAAATLSVEPFSASAVVNLKITGDADAYVIVASENPISGNPEDGKTYKEGDALAGGTVLAVREGLGLSAYEIEHSDRYKNELESNTQYHYAVWFYNFKCSGGIKYGSVTRAEATTRTTAPASLEFTAVSDTEIKVKATANSLNEEVLIAVTRNHGFNASGVNEINQGNFGIPENDAKVGDTLWLEDGEFGGEVIYKGPAGMEAVAKVAGNQLIYHFGAFSKHSDGKYSSVFAPADTITPAQIPYFEDFSGMIPFMVPIGWTGTDPQFCVASRNAGIQYTFPENKGEAVTRQTNFVLPAMDYPEKAIRLVMSYNMKVYEGRVQGGYKRTHWAATDSIVFEVSTDQGRTFRPAYAITKANADQFASTSEYLTRAVTIKGFEGASQARLQMRWVSVQKNSSTMTVESLRIIEVPACDYPMSITLDPESIVGDRASVQWEVGESGEQAWNISYAMKSGNVFGDWSEALQIAENPYELKELAMNTTYKVRVQAVCGVGSTSEWVESSEFTSGWTAPFIEDFDNVPVESSGWRKTVKFPVQWSAFLKRHDPGVNSDTLKVSDMNEIQLGSAIDYYGWKDANNILPGMGNAALSYSMRYIGGTVLLRLPVLQLDETDAADFVFSAALGTYSRTFTKVTRTDTANSMRVLVSEDGGKTFVVKDALRVWDSTAMVAIGDSTGFKISLAEYKGKQIVLALSVSGNYDSKAEDQYLWIDNVGVIYNCATARNLKVEGIEKKTALVRWNADPMVAEWIVKVSNGTTMNRFSVQENTARLTELDSATRYTVQVAHLCGTDTSAWATVSFTTAGVECDPIIGITVSEITRNSAKLTWTGDALRYKIRLRKVGTSDWANYTAQTGAYVFTALLPETEYEGGIQAVCGDAVSDTSAFVDFRSFTTAAQTCFAPEELAATPSYASVELAWTGDADNYQVAYRKEGITSVLGVFNVSGKTYTLTGLTEKTPYEARVRSACGAGDTSAWCEWIAFTTTETPVCPTPSDLKADGLTLNSAKLSWSCADAEASFILRFRPVSATSWDSVKALTAKTYELKDLTENTAYTWSVMAACSGNRYSGWATASNFTTLEETAIETSAEAALQVTAGKGQIHILNPSALQIGRVRLLGTDGALLGNWKINSNENVLLTTNHSMRVVVVVVESGSKMLRYKVLLP